MVPAKPELGPSIKNRKQNEIRRHNVRPQSTDMVSRLEHTVKNAKDNIMTTYNAIQETTGERPFGTKKISERQQVRRYSMVRDDANMWGQLIKQHGLKASIDYAMRMERLSAKYPEEANYINPEPLVK